MAERPKLSDDDLARVQEYLNSPIHRVERQPFRPLRLLLVLWVVVSLLGAASWLTARMMGVL
ncbi:MAG: DUF3094 family protein [Pseudomonadales bacterium]|nr:DUF3094 family protein [Pseudomonadales bacterium]